MNEIVTTKEPLRISLVQAPIVWEDRETNWRLFEQRISRLAGETDLVILPETFTTGFALRPESLAEPLSGETWKKMAEWARRYELAVLGSFILAEKGRYFNCALFVTPDGTSYRYNKRHLFSMAGEHRVFSPGEELVIVPYRGWNLCLQICYDLRFPVWSRNVGERYDLLIYMANWPEARSSVWKPLLMARAIENQSYVCGVNRTGYDGNRIHYRGDSALYSPKGELLLDLADADDQSGTHALDATSLEAFRKKFPVLKDADDFVLGPICDKI